MTTFLYLRGISAASSDLLILQISHLGEVLGFLTTSHLALPPIFLCNSKLTSRNAVLHNYVYTSRQMSRAEVPRFCQSCTHHVPASVRAVCMWLVAHRAFSHQSSLSCPQSILNVANRQASFPPLITLP